jgi:hypothetical protein
MAFTNILGGALAAGGLIGSIFSGGSGDGGAQDSLAKAMELIEGQQTSLNQYFRSANTALESQYKTYYGQQMQAAVDALAKSGIYGSPISQKRQNRTMQALADTYANAKSQLAGQQMTAQGSINAQKVSYYQNLANIQYQKELANAQSESAMWSGIGGIGSALLFA